MVQFSKIVLAYDDSEGSKKALQTAVDLLLKFPESTLFVAHVFMENLRNEPMDSGEASIEPTLVNSYTTDGLLVPPIALEQGATPKSSHAVVSNSSEQAMYNVKKVLEPLSSGTEYTVLEGSPAESICDYALEIDADLLIIGHSAPGGIKRKLLGTVSQKIADQAPCHVLIAK